MKTIVRDASTKLKAIVQTAHKQEIDALMQRAQEQAQNLIDEATGSAELKANILVAQAQKRAENIELDAQVRAQKQEEQARSTKLQEETARIEQELVATLSKSRGKQREELEKRLKKEATTILDAEGISAQVTIELVSGVLVARATTKIMEVRVGVDDLVARRRDEIFREVRRTLS